jgi:hypothetical protein
VTLLIYCPPQSGSYSGFYRRCESVVVPPQSGFVAAAVILLVLPAAIWFVFWFYRRCESVDATAVAMLVACFSESPLC